MKYLIIKNIFSAGRLKFILSMTAVLMFSCTIISCDKELDIQTDFPFDVEIMPVPKTIGKGEMVTIRCNIKTEGNYDGTKYYIRYFQFDGAGKLILGTQSKLTLSPNDSYYLLKQEFRLYYISESDVTQAFDIWIFDNRGHEKKISFQFNNTQQ
nr:TraQ conjugal transfer family protein [Pedobacter sp. ASV2]